jgi:hypothetical protein
LLPPPLLEPQPRSILKYTTSTTNRCTIEVSTSNTFSPVIHAVDGTIFTNANKDGQTNIDSRQFLVGQHMVGQHMVGQENVSPPQLTSSGVTSITKANYTIGSELQGLVTVNTVSAPPFDHQATPRGKEVYMCTPPCRCRRIFVLSRLAGRVPGEIFQAKNLARKS